MSCCQRTLIAAALWFTWGVPSESLAESYPDLDELAANSRLIVYGQVELVDDRLLCRVVKVLKGNYQPTTFTKPPPTGFVDPLHAPFFADLDAGERLFLFYIDHNDRPSGLGTPDLAVFVQNGRVTYPPADREGAAPPSYTARQFQQRIAPSKPRSAAPPPKDRWQLAGPWKLLLPAGYEHDVTFQHVAGRRYRMEPGSLSFAGDYELHADRLIRIPTDDRPHLTYEWQFRSRHMVHLKKQPTKSAPADYEGAVFFRPR